MSSVRQRFIDSISYLRRMGFFEEYSNLTDEEIFEKIREEDPLLKDLEEDRWVKNSVFEIDRYTVISDRKRVWGRVLEFGYHPPPEEEVELLKEFAQISRGAFRPTDIKGWKVIGAEEYFSLSTIKDV